ncbi:thrombospondin type-1 domain-containing protein 7B isoform X2 [Hippocampus comes]|uniref:thrombospondin type-1 domain-containing protein 7B isoform X2 n=1 Tax=Hippocampus comes TaxID=109280 RepID=UPI00094E8C82|nr:PREDICTED: thrombospondin type-1 domain-containing protein 7B isoform X2 [Hippocampus comes]
MGWTMTLKDDFGVIAWAGGTGNYLSFFVLWSLLLIHVRTDIVFHMDHQFTWKTGQWGHCMGEDCGSGGVQSRTVWCVHTEGWTTHHSHCNHMDKPESRRHCFKVCNWHQDLFEWELSPWEGCVLVPFFSNELKLRTAECITAQHGIQRRKVQCMRTSNRTTVTSRICDFFSQRPPVEQACLIPCPQDCVVSDFTSWSGCSRTCGAGLQHRTRHVLTMPMYGGASCPNLTETRTCSGSVGCPSGEDEYQYSLKVGAWSECRLPHHKDTLINGRTTVDFSSNKENNTVMLHRHASHYRQDHHTHRHHQKYPMSWELEVGYQTRQVRCTRSDGKNTMLSLCAKYNSPVTYQACVMPRDCYTSDWLSWSPCSKTCRSTDLSPGYRLRSRVLTQIPLSGGKQCPILEEKEACNIIGDLLPNCPRYEWRATDWDECLVSPLLSRLDRRRANITRLCGGGVQTRKTYCVQVPDDSTPHHRKEVSRPVTARLCGGQEAPVAIKNCSIPCQHRCLLSRWSPWGSCVHDNCKDPEGKKGFIQRRREVLWASSSPLDVCPHLVESIPCEEPACYLWQVQQGKCTPNKSSCGPGTVVQSAKCINAEGEDVPMTYCTEDPPLTQVPCEVACPADCVVSVWSSWSLCSHSCASKTAEGRQSRTRTVLALPGKGGKECPGAPALEEWRVCNDHPCLVFYWEVSTWGPCIHDTVDLNRTYFRNSTATCALGAQIRKVSCMKMNGGSVVSKRCPDSARPETIRPCVLPCVKDCIVTPFSEWTACPSTCMPENATSATQSRHRTIIQRSANGGQECPDTLYEERECESLAACPIYRWRTHKWHACTLVPNSVQRSLSQTAESCGNGLETRGLSCVGENDEAANLTECLRWAGPLPAQIRACRVACKDDCTLTAWSKFSECIGCGSFQSRKRSLTGRSKKKVQCLDEALYPLEEKEACPCEEYLSQPFGNWSDCILREPSTPGLLHSWMSQQEVKECGQGLRYRAVACVDQQGRLVEPTLCTDTGYMVEVCHIPCPLDCKLSDWSAWSACSSSCGGGLKVRSKWLREKAFNGGRPCPKLDLKNQAQVNEALPCHSECNKYEWRIEPWSICTINTVGDSPSCGEGVQSRKIRCVKKGKSGEVSTVEDSQCDQEEMPPRAQVCFLACHNDCVLSPWESWSNCLPQCERGSERNRSRQILRLPAVGSAACPEMIQSESCSLNTTCFTYQYQVSEWSTCRLSENAICGGGARQRLLDCVRSDGQIADLQKCEQLGLVMDWKLVENCVVDCPVSCVLSDWSPWGECSHTCGNQGQSVRTRRILQDAHEEGRPCPNQLIQTKPCPISPCYMWLLSDWSPCTIEGADCGEGFRRRNLSCVIHKGNWTESPPVPVAEEFCGDKLKKEIQQDVAQPCFVPCQGDCHLAEWSSWSSCQLTCVEGRSFESTGRQSRSRAVIIQVPENQDTCPQQVFQTQPCKGGQCYSYQWRTGGWSNNERAVWCQRSDGVIVTGGCFPQKRPSMIRHCHPPCAKPFSHCTSSGVCRCEKGYTEVMTTHGFLDYCTRTPGVDTNLKADVKTNSGRLKPSQGRDRLTEWTLRPVGPDGRVKLWVYAVTAVGFILILFIIAFSFLVCKSGKIAKTTPPPQKPLTLAYDGDIDM